MPGYFLNKICGPVTFLKKKTNRVQVFSSEFGVIYETKLFTDHFWATYSVVRDLFITISLTYNDS